MRALVAALALVACAPAPAPVPDVAGEVEAVSRRVDRLVWRMEADEQLHRIEREFVLARTARERERAQRAWLLAGGRR